MTDLSDQLLLVRPQTRGTEGWVASAAGSGLLERVHASAAGAAGPAGSDRSTRSHRRRRLLIGVAAAGVLGTAGTAYAVVRGAAPTDRHVVLCNEVARLDSDGSGIPVGGDTPDDARAACAAAWPRMWPGTVQPANLAVCVYPPTSGGAGGGQFVIPADAGVDDAHACHALGAQPAS